MKLEKLKETVDQAKIKIALCQNDITRMEKKIFSNFGIKEKEIDSELKNRQKEISLLIEKEKKLFNQAQDTLNDLQESEDYDF